MRLRLITFPILARKLLVEILVMLTIFPVAIFAWATAASAVLATVGALACKAQRPGSPVLVGGDGKVFVQEEVGGHGGVGYPLPCLHGVLGEHMHHS